MERMIMLIIYQFILLILCLSMSEVSNVHKDKHLEGL